MVERQKDDRADRGHARAVNAVDVLKPVTPVPPNQIEQPAAENRTNNASRMSTTVPSPVVLTILLKIKPSTSPSSAIIDIGHSRQRR